MPEVPLIPDRDLATLLSFNSHGHITLSAYLRLDTPQHRASAYDDFARKMQTHMDECGPRPECREAIMEDMEIVSLYLKTNGHRQYPGLAIFSCAAALFWRAYPLESPVPTQVTVGSKFNLEPLRGSAK
jgi:hypothetical protein